MTILCLYRFQLAGPNLVSLFHAQPWKGLDNAQREVPLRSADGLHSEAGLRRLRRSYRGNYRTCRVLLSRSVSVHGLCAVDLSRESARHRNVLESLKPKLYHAGFRGTVARSTLATPTKSQTGASTPTSAVISLRCARVLYAKDDSLASTGTDGVRLRFHDHRSVPGALPVGTISPPQGCRQAPHADRPARQYPLFCPHFQRKTTRCQRSGSSSDRARRLLHHGSRLHRLCPARMPSTRHGVLRHTCQEESRVPPPRESHGRQDHWPTQRSDDRAHRPQDVEQYPDPLRRISMYDPEHGRVVLVFLTNNFVLAH